MALRSTECEFDYIPKFIKTVIEFLFIFHINKMVTMRVYYR